MGQSMMPDHQISRAARNRNSQLREIFFARDRKPSGKPFKPRLETAVKARHARESTLRGGRIGEGTEFPLRAKGNRPRKTHVPVQVRAGKFPSRFLRRIEARLVHTSPKIFASPKLCKGPVYAIGIPIGPKRGVMKQRNPDAVTLRPAVPRLGAFQVRAGKLINRACTAARQFSAETASCRMTYPFSS